MNFLCQRAESGAPSAMLAAMRCTVASTSVVGDGPVDEAEPERVLRPEDLPEEQDLEHGVRPELGDERRELIRRLDEAEPLDGHPESAGGPAYPQIAHDRDPEAPTHAVALDEGDGRVAAGAHRFEGGPENAGVDPAPPLVDPPGRELADVRPGAERPAAGAAEDHAADGGVGVELRHRVLEAEGDLDAERVPARRRIDDHGGDRAVPRYLHPRGLAVVLRFRPRGGLRRPDSGRFVRHRVLLSLVRRGRASAHPPGLPSRGAIQTEEARATRLPASP